MSPQILQYCEEHIRIDTITLYAEKHCFYLQSVHNFYQFQLGYIKTGTPKLLFLIPAVKLSFIKCLPHSPFHLKLEPCTNNKLTKILNIFVTIELFIVHIYCYWIFYALNYPPTANVTLLHHWSTHQVVR